MRLKSRAPFKLIQLNMFIWLQKILMRCIFAVHLKKVNENGGRFGEKCLFSGIFC